MALDGRASEQFSKESITKVLKGEMAPVMIPRAQWMSHKIKKNENERCKHPQVSLEATFQCKDFTGMKQKETL